MNEIDFLMSGCMDRLSKLQFAYKTKGINHNDVHEELEALDRNIKNLKTEIYTEMGEEI